MKLVTGGTGLLGSHLLVELTKKDSPIRSIYRDKKRLQEVQHIFQYYFRENWKNYWQKIEWIEADILDIESMRNVMPNVEEVYHSAGFVSFYGEDFKKCIKINREGTANIVNLCIHFGIKKLGYVSSTAAVGGTEGKLITEKDKWQKTEFTSGYSISKYLAEKEVWRGIEEGLNAVIINPCVILGPGKWDESSLKIFTSASKGMSYYPTGSNATVDARDVASCLIKLVESPINNNKFLCIGTNQNFKELTGEISHQSGKNRPNKPISKTSLLLFYYFSFPFYYLLRIRSPFSRDTINSAYKNLSYDNSAILKATNHSFYSLQETVKNVLDAKKFELESN
jgi:nucleoside-diphosphate-sugar epimerase